MQRPKIYLALCVIALFLELAWIVTHAPPACGRCKQALVSPSPEVPELCTTCVEQIRAILAPKAPPPSLPYLPPYPVDSKDPIVTLETTRGTVQVELFARKAPLSTENFLRYVRAHRYDEVIFHRLEDYICVTGRLRGGYGVPLSVIPQFPPIPSESQNGLRNLRGTLQLPRLDADQNTATGDFAFNLKDNPYYDWRDSTPQGAGYAVFGQVIQGFEVLDQTRSLPLVTRAIGPGYEHMPRDPVKVRRAYEVQPVTLGEVAPLDTRVPAGR